MNSGKVLLVALTSAAAGALAGILFAPASGSKTRRRILKTGENYAEAMKEKFDELLNVVTEKFEKVKEEVVDYTEKKTNKQGVTTDAKTTSII